MASKRKQELEAVVEMVKDMRYMRYVDKLRDTIYEHITETVDEMVKDDTVECDNEY